jgi:ribokinase
VLKRIICVGELMTDVVAVLSGEIAYGSDTSVKITYVGGGAAANVASWLGVKGADVILVARVGEDTSGIDGISEVERCNVKSAVVVDPRATTGTVIVLVAQNGERTMLPDSGANGLIEAKDVPALNSSDRIYVSGYLLLNSQSRDAAREILENARNAGAQIFLDPASAAPIRLVGADNFLGWLKQVDVLLANLDEATALTDEPDPWRAAERLLDYAQTVVVKLGADGAIGLTRSARAQVSAFTVPHVVDTTGAGDSFAAGFLLSEGILEESLRSGAKVAAECVVSVGARPQVAKS